MDASKRHLGAQTETEIVTLIPHKVFTDKKEIGEDQRYAQEFL